jgi:uncharacterized damage-inducible protein DinB
VEIPVVAGWPDFLAARGAHRGDHHVTWAFPALIQLRAALAHTYYRRSLALLRAALHQLAAVPAVLAAVCLINLQPGGDLQRLGAAGGDHALMAALQPHLLMMATYNRWANRRLYGAAAALTDDQYRRDVGVYFKSVHGTLNHLLVADRIWMHRLQGTGEQPRTLDAILCQDLAALAAARATEDERILGFVAARTQAALDAVWEYRTLNGTPQRQPVREILAHLFNHQTHHRGHAHAALTRLGVPEPPSLDLLIMQRELAADP